MIEIKSRPIQPDITVKVPGSKSYTHRTLIAAALSNGLCKIENPLRSEDTSLTLKALQQMGAKAKDQGGVITLTGKNGKLEACENPIYLGNSGTSMRLLAAIVVLGKGEYTLTGSPRMCERPIQPLLDSLTQLGINVHSENNTGCPPIRIQGGTCKGGHTRIDCGVSSQYLSGLMLMAPCLEKGLSIDVINGPVSKPYIDMTADIMAAFGIGMDRRGYEHFNIPGKQVYQSGTYKVEPDGSQAGYFWAAAAITGKRIKVKSVTLASRQGDVRLSGVFEKMGCRVDHDPDGIAVTGGPLKAIDIDMGNMPDMVPTLAVAAAFAEGTTIIRNVAHLRAKECDRLAAVSAQLTKMGIQTSTTENELRVTGGSAKGTDIETYDDHRIAMSFAVAGLKVPGIKIEDEHCVNKSFPNYWEVFEALYT
ncbi:MAG: 3-phosphoshikimate 1-carboxyvinyltransferase [Desulfobacteraceae bacterium]|nr:3-phosphoshikimate 1-carboxyvinyltransferase [Desulfobacteraceae bacterium]